MGHKYKDLVLQVWGLARARQHLPIKNVSNLKNRGLRHNTGLLYHMPHHDMPCNVLVFTGELKKKRFAWKDICIRPQLWEYFKLYKFVS